ncbi:hypothetical protein D9M69_519170 [compost metagenome]
MVRVSTSGGEKAASLVPAAPRAKHWRLSVHRACQFLRCQVGFCVAPTFKRSQESLDECQPTRCRLRHSPSVHRSLVAPRLHWRNDSGGNPAELLRSRPLGTLGLQLATLALSLRTSRHAELGALPGPAERIQPQLGATCFGPGDRDFENHLRRAWRRRRNPGPVAHLRHRFRLGPPGLAGEPERLAHPRHGRLRPGADPQGAEHS